MIGAAVMVGGIAETLPFVRLNLLLLLHNALGRPCRWRLVYNIQSQVFLGLLAQPQPGRGHSDHALLSGDVW